MGGGRKRRRKIEKTFMETDFSWRYLFGAAVAKGAATMPVDNPDN